MSARAWLSAIVCSILFWGLVAVAFFLIA